MKSRIVLAVLAAGLVAVGVGLTALALAIETHTCGVDCSGTTFDWARGVAVAGSLAALGALLGVARNSDPERQFASVVVTLAVAFVLHVASFSILAAQG